MHQRGRLAGQRGENQLGHVGGRMGIAREPAQRSGVNQRQMPLNQFGKGALGFLLGIAADQFSVFGHGVSHYGRRQDENRTKKMPSNHHGTVKSISRRWRSTLSTMTSILWPSSNLR